jgi:hypothetical protein
MSWRESRRARPRPPSPPSLLYLVPWLLITSHIAVRRVTDNSSEQARRLGEDVRGTSVTAPVHPAQQRRPPGRPQRPWSRTLAHFTRTWQGMRQVQLEEEEEEEEFNQRS